jgi:hypothetical protein
MAGESGAVEPGAQLVHLLTNVFRSDQILTFPAGGDLNSTVHCACGLPEDYPSTNATFVCELQLPHLVRYVPMSDLKAHFPFPRFSGVQRAYGFESKLSMWTKAVSEPTYPFQQLLHLARYLPVSAFKAT